ncbi:bile salt-activated lipase-like isoform X1 [Stegostoma tigrinum]|uniref:bile salt-activated lipase-like isoform X1 n=1 Tax=Stegostoma tigrinum TaxID=3053191 RepID=UPI00202B160E|nr:bile salt-activated lipase-like isoform X1 [Stegostoma tigrinum]
MASWPFLCLVLSSCFLGATARATLGVVETEGGRVEGINKRDGFFASVDIFKGIPFAAKPERFVKAAPHPGWTDVLKAKDFKPRCLQTTLSQKEVFGSEDCLYLNIWVPHGSKVSTNLPVMVWIFGGGFLMGAGHGANFLKNYLYDGREIATRGKVIVVSFNYRLGPLGFLSTGDTNAPGNQALWDQHMAISWVKRNIAAFGGDPDNITLFGESAGGASVSLQTLTPYNKGLIKRAISQSGVAICGWAVQRNPMHWAQQLAQKVGCPIDDPAIMVACLKITDPKAVTLAIPLKLINLEAPLVSYLIWSPVIDGDFLPDEPRKLYHNVAGVGYIAGVNNMDGHIFAGLDVPSINQAGLGKTYPSDLYHLIRGLTIDKGVKAANLTYEHYTKDWPADPSQELIKRTVVNLETDVLFLVPTQLALDLHYQHAQGAGTYSYLFSYPSRAPIYPKWMGADHAEDLQYVFGKPFSTPLGYRPREREVSRNVIAYWTNFAHTGDPNRGGLDVPTPWIPYTSLYTQYLEINKDIDMSSVKQRLRYDTVNFWNQTYTAI